MYRVLILLVFINLTSSHWCKGKQFCKRKQNNYHNDRRNNWHYNGGKGPDDNNSSEPPAPTGDKFEQMSNAFINADKLLQSFCNENPQIPFNEVKGKDSFRLNYLLRDFTEKDINVKIKHRLIYVAADDGNNSVKDVRILPNGLDVNRASWVLEQKILKIDLPYAPQSSNNSRNCGTINETLIKVPPMDPSGFTLRSIPLDSGRNIDFNLKQY